MAKWREEHREEYNKRLREYMKPRSKRETAEIKRRVLTHYSRGILACVKCGFSNIDALSIDHINGNGNQHRRELGDKRGVKFYKWLIAEEFPEGYQTLCMNCQFIKARTNNERSEL